MLKKRTILENIFYLFITFILCLISIGTKLNWWNYIIHYQKVFLVQLPIQFTLRRTLDYSITNLTLTIKKRFKL